jgi:hypothetical protein
MLFFHTVESDVEIRRDNPLFVGHFFDLQGMWWTNRKKRQKMIVSVAFAWYKLVKKQLKTPGMISEELIMTALTNEVRDAKIIIEKFFTITRLGFNLKDGMNKSPTLVTPKRLPLKYVEAIEEIASRITFNPGLPPTNKTLVQTTVSVRKNNLPLIRVRIKEEEREELMPAIDWLMQQEGPVTFYYRPAGKLQARDTSVWPIRAIETWPGWLRTEMFGATIDIENAFCQFLLDHLEKKHEGKMEQLRLKYPDLLRAAYDKQKFREELCLEILHRPPTNENISTVKKLIMALANGSNASPKLMVGDGRLPEAVMIVRQAAPEVSPTQMMKSGKRLQSIAKQFRSAKRELCIMLLNSKPTRLAQKQIFQLYFQWEKEARYKIWEAIGQTGLMLHDGLDGVITNLSERELVELVKEKTNIRVSAETPTEEEVV